MTSQLFKTLVNVEVFTDFLSSVCDKKEGQYTFNNQSFKKANLFQLTEPFIQHCKNHYHLSKHKYLDRKMTYNNLITVLRQVAKSHDITYLSNIKYSKSDYNIEYTFFI